MRRGGSLTAILVLLIIVSTSTAFGGSYTEVRYPGSNPEEPGHATILGNIYGGTFSGTGDNLGYGLSTVFSNGTVSAFRVYDIDGPDETIHIFTGSQSNIDQIWTDGVAHVTAQAKHAGNSQSFGWNGGGLETNYFELLTHNDVALETVVSVTITGDFLWGTQPNGDEWWSKNSLNLVDTLDHLVTYKIEGLQANGTVWLLFWEDLGGSPPSSDRDFNDFVIEVIAIPEPATICLLGLGGLGLLRRKRSKA